MSGQILRKLGNIQLQPLNVVEFNSSWKYELRDLFSSRIPVSYTLSLHTSSKTQEFWEQKCPCLYKPCSCLETRVMNRLEGWEERHGGKGHEATVQNSEVPLTQWKATACGHVIKTNTAQNRRQPSYGCEVTVCNRVLHMFQQCQLLEVGPGQVTRWATSWRNNRGAGHTVASERKIRR